VSGLFPNVLHVARREYLVRVRGRAFVITTALLAVAVIGVIFVPTILAAAGVADPPTVAVVVEADNLETDPIVAIQTALLLGPEGTGDADEGEERAQVVRADDSDEAAQAVRDGDYDALLTITRNEDGALAFEYLGSASPTNQTRLLVTAAATSLAIGDRLDQEGITPEQRAVIFAPPAFTAVPIDPDDARNQEDFGGAFILAYAIVILTFMGILTYGNWVAQSVAEEKSGRVMELLITAATPRQLLIGKVFGTGAAGLTQYLAIALAAAIGYLVSGPVSDALGVGGEAPITLPDLDPTMIISFGAFFLLGFLLYATLYAAAGSMVSRVEDAQQAAGPLIFLAIGGYLAAFAGLNEPDAQWVVVLSIIPFFSPYLMPARMLLTTPSAGEIVLALVLLVVTVSAALWIASRIYSAGVLLYGQRVGLRSVWRATRVAR
jgi:ABC-2 type transport system permease protein